jgi:NYN domain
MLVRWWNSAISRSQQFCRPRLYAVPDRRLPRALHVPAGRTLHVLDLENLMGGPFQSQLSMHTVSNWYRNTAPVQHEDHVTLAVNPALAIAARSEWPGTLLRVASGPDGADNALLNELRDAKWIASHFDRVIIGSGDGIFACAIGDIREQGITVGVLSRERSLSRELRRSADFAMLFTNVDSGEDVA